MRRKLLLISACFILMIARVIAQEVCSEFVETALRTAEQSCLGIGRNQACFGNMSLTAVAQPDATNFQFSGVGDITDVAAIQSLQLSGYDPENGVWGVVMMQVQADIPNTLPGQNVTVLLFGDVAIRNAATSVVEQVPPEQEQIIQANANVNVRSLPNTNSTTIGSIAPNTSIIATGRTEDSQWIRVRFGAETGWIFAQLLNSEFDPSALLVVTNPEVPLYSPMQAFYLTTGIGRPGCNNVPDDGMLVQTPDGVASINIVVNEISVEMGSTVYFSLNDEGDMEIAPVEGSARIESNGENTTIIEGAFVEVPLDEEFAADGPPSEPQSYLGDEDIEVLPLEALERDIEPDAGLTPEEFQDFEEYEPILDFVDIEDADDVFDYIESSEDPNLVEYLIEEGYTDFGSDLENYFETSLGYELDDYEAYTGDDSDSENAQPDDDSGIEDNNGSEDEFDDTPEDDDSEDDGEEETDSSDD